MELMCEDSPRKLLEFPEEGIYHLNRPPFLSVCRFYLSIIESIIQNLGHRRSFELNCVTSSYKELQPCIDYPLFNTRSTRRMPLRLWFTETHRAICVRPQTSQTDRKDYRQLLIHSEKKNHSKKKKPKKKRLHFKKSMSVRNIHSECRCRI